MSAALSDWVAMLPEAVATGPLPSQASADRWADAMTGGQIPVFPLQLDAATELVLANALATDIRWAEPFNAVSAARLGDGPLAAGLTTVLAAPAGHRR